MVPMSKTLAPSVTARDPKGRKFISIVEGAYNKAGLSGEEAQRVNNAPGLADLAGTFIAKNRARFSPPEGGRVHIVRIPVLLDRDWQEAINAAGPDTPDIYDVSKVGDQYPPKSGTIKEVEIVLMNFGPNGGDWHRAIAWANEYKLKRTDPRHVFAIGERNPHLHKELGSDYMYVVATGECAFGGGQRACRVWWDGSRRECLLYWVKYCGSSADWFAFLRE